MSVAIIPTDKQASGEFNNGAILENKPIGFPQDGGELRPYSNLFYWAHAWTPREKSLIGEHPHQGFEIITFVLKGSIEHYDNKSRAWRELGQGDAQIIRAGSGISHAELLHEATEMFQIWLDPDLQKTMGQPASYDDYKAESFPVSDKSGMTIKTYCGEGAPMKMTTPGITIKEIRFAAGEHELALGDDRLLSAFVLEGVLQVDGGAAVQKDFVIVDGQVSVTVTSPEPSRMFIIESPATVDYETYANRLR